jgi:sigma-B regulation protein RsbU (phosphoserine phosphatase)
LKSPLVPDERRLQQIRRLTDVSRALIYAESFEEVLRLTVERAAQLLEAQAAVLMLSGEDGLMTIRASAGLAAVERDGGHSLDETLIEQLQRVLGVTFERFLGVPLVVGRQVIGILAVALPEDMPSGAEEQELLLSALADQAAVALEKNRLDERGRFRDRLIGIVSHDLRNPINAVVLGASVLLDGDDLSAHTTKTLARIKSAAERAGRMIGDLLDYTQAYLGGGIRVDRKPSDLGGIARQVLEEVEIAHPECDFELVCGGDMNAEVDADRIAQVLGNLVSNAVNYGQAGAPIRIELTGEDERVTMAVHNRGATIPPERLRDIFAPMQQVAPESGRGYRSVGLGLYIVESIVTSHRGTIHVESTADEGTTFTVRIPRLTIRALS